MTILVIGLLLFLGAHSVSIVNVAWRDAMAARLGVWTWKGIYALVAIPGLAMIIWGYGATRLDPIVLYVPPTWSRHLMLLLMVPVFPLFLSTYLPGRIKNAARHPMLAATKLWAAAHLLVNGSLADVLLFGSFLVWAILDRMSMNRREARPIPTAPPSSANDLIAVIGGLLIYAGFVAWVHQHFIGVPVIG